MRALMIRKLKGFLGKPGGRKMLRRELGSWDTNSADAVQTRPAANALKVHRRYAFSNKRWHLFSEPTHWTGCKPSWISSQEQRLDVCAAGSDSAAVGVVRGDMHAVAGKLSCLERSQRRLLLLHGPIVEVTPIGAARVRGIRQKNYSSEARTAFHPDPSDVEILAICETRTQYRWQP